MPPWFKSLMPENYIIKMEVSSGEENISISLGSEYFQKK